MDDKPRKRRLSSRPVRSPEAVPKWHRDTLLRKLLSSLQAVGDHLAVRDDGNITALAFDLRLPDGEEEAVRHGLRGHGEGDTVHQLVLEEDDGVGVTDGRL